MRSLVELRNVTKYYEDQKVLDNINITIKENDLIGLIGSNGSGKTTLLSILCGLITDMDGELIKEKNIKIGALIDEPIFYSHLSAFQNLSLIAQIKGLKNIDIEYLLEQVALKECKKKKYRDFSLGMRQRLGIAAALINNPEIILLDEPTNGLDPYGIREIREIIYTLHQSGKTVLISSHVLSELEQICTSIILLEKGCILFSDNKETFLEKSGNVIVIYSNNIHLINELLKKLDEVESTQVFSNSISVSFKTRMTIESTKRLLEQQGLNTIDIEIKENKMENALFNLIS
ncbi:MAG: ATP-binding cassette domain-containing protein [Bacteroidales bacterium]|nr:ATP-binding cassette domain-containing protein [Bacteroidales bacterium]